LISLGDIPTLSPASNSCQTCVLLGRLLEYFARGFEMTPKEVKTPFFGNSNCAHAASRRAGGLSFRPSMCGNETFPTHPAAACSTAILSGNMAAEWFSAQTHSITCLRKCVPPHPGCAWQMRHTMLHPAMPTCTARAQGVQSGPSQEWVATPISSRIEKTHLA
jgi:hypothetical protein